VLTRTDYEPLELLIVDNDSAMPETRSLFEKLSEDERVRIISYPGDFNYAAINNHAVREARGDIVVLMNNDIDVCSPLWLEEMVSHALRPEVGAVGAKLIYPSGEVQHAGVLLGVGHGAGHFFHGAPRDEVGYFGFLCLTRRVAAVTAACMAIRRSVYAEVGGFDAERFPIAFNDVDFCLRLGKSGYAVVWTPFAELYHVESTRSGRRGCLGTPGNCALSGAINWTATRSTIRIARLNRPALNPRFRHGGESRGWITKVLEAVAYFSP
jgi:GT2 family glycosyltransferase